MDILPVWKGALPSLADQGLLTDLSSDLEEEGTLRASYPEKFWELTAVDGRIMVRDYGLFRQTAGPLTRN